MSEIDYHIDLLANKIKAYAKIQNTHERTDREFQLADLKHNASSVLFIILKKLFQEPLPLANIEQIIDNFNTANQTNYRVKSFMDKGWLRLINGQYFFPSLIQHHFYELEKSNPTKQKMDVGVHKQEIQCLLEIDRAIRTRFDYTLTEIEINTVAQAIGSSITAKQLEQLQIISKGENNYKYVFSGWNNHSFKNRILAQAWFEFVGDDTEKEKLSRFFRFIEFSNCWPNDLSYFASQEQVKAVMIYAEDHLRNDPDVNEPEDEVRNDKFDRQRYHYTNSFPEVLIYEFKETEPYNFLIELKNYKFYDHELFTYREHSVFFSLLTRLLICYDDPGQHYPITTGLIKTLNNPYIKTQLLNIIREEFPWVLAHFLKDPQLSSLTFYYLDKLTLKSTWFISELGSNVSSIMIDKIKDKLWQETFDFYIETAVSSFEYLEFAQPIAEILHFVTEETFKFNVNNYKRSTDRHATWRSRYEFIIKKLPLIHLKRSHVNYSEHLPLLIGKILPEIYSMISSIPNWKQVNNLLAFDSAWVDVRIELLKFLKFDFSDQELYFRPDDALTSLADEIGGEIYKYLINYFSITEFKVYSFYNKAEIKTAKRFGDFGLEIIDWAEYLIFLEKKDKFQELDKEFEKQIPLRSAESRYDDDNMEQLFKVSIYVKILLTAYISLKHQQTKLYVITDMASKTVTRLENLIVKYSLRFNFDDPANDRLDLFSSRNFFYRDGPYQYSMTARLYRAVNYFPTDQIAGFVEDFFKDDLSYEKLLRAHNQIDNQAIKKLIASKIEGLNAEVFIKNSSYQEVRTVLAELANSTTLYRLAQPFLEVLERRSQKEGPYKFDLKHALFSIKLLLALKNSKRDELNALQPPESPYNVHKIDPEDVLEKAFYLALQYCDNEQDYEESERILLGLNQQQPKNVRFAFNLYKVRALKEQHSGKPNTGKQVWDEFQKLYGANISAELTTYEDYARSLDLIYYIRNEEWKLFDQIINILPAVFLYQDFLIIAIYNAYIKRNMEETAYLFIQSGITYLEENGLIASEELNRLEQDCLNDDNILKIRNVLLGLRSMPAAKIPRISPSILNNQTKLPEFILKEFIEAGKIMREKIKAVESIKHEDNYNDVLLAILRMRLPVWGWEITDQNRSGSSPRGKSAGEVDIVIQAGGVTLALVEALKLTGSYMTTLQPHVLKCAGYNRNLDFFVVISYFTGNRVNWPGFLDIYKQDITNISYPLDQALNVTTGIKHITSYFQNSNGIEVLKTVHGINNRTIYHVLIDVSKDSKLPTVPKRVMGTTKTKRP